MKTAETVALEKAIRRATRKTGVFGCYEVTIGFCGRERVDYMTYDTKGIFRCYEIKVSKADFHSAAAKSFVGHYNYYVLTRELYNQVKEEKKHQKGLTKEVKKGLSDREKATDKGVKNITKTTEQGNDEQSKGTELAQKGLLAGTETFLNTSFQLKQKNNNEQAKADADLAEQQMTFSIAGAIGKCFQFLGPIAGPIAAAVVMSTLTGLMQWALSSAFNKKKNSSKATNTKVVSGMLTYDSGNVQNLRPFVGNDGSLYWATEDNKPHNGVSLLTQPTATTINGHPSAFVMLS